MPRYKRLPATVGLFFFLTAMPFTTIAETPPVGGEVPRRTLSLQDALKRIKESPTLKAIAKNIDIQGGFAEQARLLPNPDLTIEIENFSGEDDLEGFNSTETTVAISQLIELGGKRNARRVIANHQMSLAEKDFQIQSLFLKIETMRAFYALLASQERLNQARQLLSLAEQSYQTVNDRIAAGKVSSVQKLRASVELNLARNAWEASQRQLVQDRLSLSSLWGASEPDFDIIIGDFGTLQKPLTWEAIQATLTDNIELKRWETELARKKALLDLEHAKSTPDITLSFGIRNFQETDDNAFVAGLEFPLQFFDRNQGGRTAAQSEVSQSRYQRDAAAAKLISDLQSAYQKLLSTFHEARTIKQDIMPTAEQANQATQIGYQDGKFDYLEALDAQRTLFEIKAQYMDAFSAYHSARFDIMKLTGNIDL